MASYEEIYNLKNETALRNKISVACVVAADKIRQEDVAVENHANRIIWAERAFADPDAKAKQMMWALLAANNALDKEVILTAGDDLIQSKVDDAINIVAQGIG